MLLLPVLAVMITDLIVSNYQSLEEARLELGAFNVVTGPTGSGKSSVIRAFQLLVFNAPGNAFITTGAKKCTVGVGVRDEGWAVVIERGATRGKDCYRLSQAVSDVTEPLVKDYTKLGGKVPEPIADKVALSPLNFAGQFDPPYLLTETAGSVARTLGELTNVTLVFNAAREAGRRRNALAATLRTEEEMAARCEADASRFATLKARRAAVEAAEAALERHTQASAQADRLRAALARLAAAQAIQVNVARPPEPPDTGPLERAAQRYFRVRYLVDEIERQRGVMTTYLAQSGVAAANIHTAEAASRKVLADAGHCPTCGQAILADGHSTEHQAAGGQA